MSARIVGGVVEDPRPIGVGAVFSLWTFLGSNVRIPQSPERYQAETLRRLRTGKAVTAPEYIEKWQHLQHIRQGALAMFAGSI